LNADIFAKFVDEPSFGGLDRATVQLHDRNTGASGLRTKGCEKGRFAASPDPVELGHDWAVFVQAVKEIGELSLAADHPCGRLLRQDVSNSPSHGQPIVGQKPRRLPAAVHRFVTLTRPAIYLNAFLTMLFLGKA
jgi:hypothetical protein